MRSWHYLFFYLREGENYKRLGSRPDRLKHSCVAEDVHHSFEVVPKYLFLFSRSR